MKIKSNWQVLFLVKIIKEFLIKGLSAGHSCKKGGWRHRVRAEDTNGPGSNLCIRLDRRSDESMTFFSMC